jgi:hypothetical protein
MATVTITEILGGDNIAGSRITINDNFKKLANAINTIETYLDTSFTPGAALNVGSALIKRYTRPTTDQIFTCEATGLFSGNLNVGTSLGVTNSATIGQGLTVSGNLTLNGTAGAGSITTSSIPFSQNAAFLSPQLWASSTSNSLVIDPQLLTGSGATRSITTTTAFGKVGVIRFDFSSYTGSAPNDCNTITLPSVTDPNVLQGQIIHLIVDTEAGAGISTNFAIDPSTLDSGTYTTVEFNGTAGSADDAAIMRQSIITVFADDNGWRILSNSGSDVSIS